MKCLDVNADFSFPLPQNESIQLHATDQKYLKQKVLSSNVICLSPYKRHIYGGFHIYYFFFREMVFFHRLSRAYFFTFHALCLSSCFYALPEFHAIQILYSMKYISAAFPSIPLWTITDSWLTSLFPLFFHLISVLWFLALFPLSSNLSAGFFLLLDSNNTSNGQPAFS